MVSQEKLTLLLGYQISRVKLRVEQENGSWIADIIRVLDSDHVTSSRTRMSYETCSIQCFILFYV
ncbi:MAG: hypothetical protein EAX81_00170 [Candidatus Thorarchaeota archaeon]|nr:hypothetical protein [Candidatus Thorarchaeota archaeon]